MLLRSPRGLTPPQANKTTTSGTTSGQRSEFAGGPLASLGPDTQLTQSLGRVNGSASNRGGGGGEEEEAAGAPVMANLFHSISNALASRSERGGANGARIEESTTAPAATSAAAQPAVEEEEAAAAKSEDGEVYKSFDERNPSSSTFV